MTSRQTSPIFLLVHCAFSIPVYLVQARMDILYHQHVCLSPEGFLNCFSILDSRSAIKQFREKVTLGQAQDMLVSN